MKHASLMLVISLAAACGGADSKRNAAAPAPADCHPVVSGCGCAYECAYGRRMTSEGRGMAGWKLTPAAGDRPASPVEATLERWCFDDAGHGGPAGVAPAAANRCMDVFNDRSPCGGECIPSTAYLGCHTVPSAVVSETMGLCLP